MPFLAGSVFSRHSPTRPTAHLTAAFFADADVKDFVRLDGIVTLVDAKHIERHLDEEKPDGTINESVNQLAFADRILLNKVDLVPGESDLERIEQRLRGINGFAPIRRCTRANVSVSDVLDIAGFDIERTLERDPAFLDGRGPAIKHDAAITSVSLNQSKSVARHLRGVKDGELDFESFEEWISGVLEGKGEDVYRMKGVLSIAHSPFKFVMHGVHMLIEGGYAEPWAEGEPRESKLVFIGKGLDAKALAAGFNSCLASPENSRSKIEKLRFGLRQRVECQLGDGDWVSGEVVQLLYRDDCMPPGLVAPYQVKLDDGKLIYAPEDGDHVIRAELVAGSNGDGDDDDHTGSTGGGNEHTHNHIAIAPSITDDEHHSHEHTQAALGAMRLGAGTDWAQQPAASNGTSSSS